MNDNGGKYVQGTIFFYYEDIIVIGNQMHWGKLFEVKKREMARQVLVKMNLERKDNWVC